jgi:hypothetical protein
VAGKVEKRPVDGTIVDEHNATNTPVGFVTATSRG